MLFTNLVAKPKIGDYLGRILAQVLKPSQLLILLYTNAKVCLILFSVHVIPIFHNMSSVI